MSTFRRGVWLHRYAVTLSAATFLLIIAGGLVTSTGSGLAVPDWPLSFGQVFPRMDGGVLYEHGHRLIASLVGMLTVGLAIFAWRVEPRPMVRRLAWVMVGAVILQGLLGGMTVLLQLPDAISIAHAGLAQVFFALTVTMAAVTSLRAPNPASPRPDRTTLHLVACTAAAIYIQILIGAVVRHTGAGLAIPTFPLANGRLIPDFTSSLVAWQVAHRGVGLVVAALVIATSGRVFGRHTRDPRLMMPAATLLVLLCWQIFLGALTIWSLRAILPTTAHVAGGALVWAASVLLMVRCRLSPAPAAIPAEPALREAAAR